MGRETRKLVFWVSDIARLKPVSSVTETRLKSEISSVASLDILLSKQRITKALIRLRGCSGWSAPLLFPNPRRQVFLCRGPYLGRGARWLSGRVLDSAWRGCRFQPHQRCCVVFLSKTLYPKKFYLKTA